MRSMRIAFFTETFWPGTNGIIRRLLATIEELQKQGDEVLIVAPAHPGGESYQNAPVIRLPSMPMPFYRGFRFGLPFLGTGTQNTLDTFAPDIIHVINPISLGRAGLWYARN